MKNGITHCGGGIRQAVGDTCAEKQLQWDLVDILSESALLFSFYFRAFSDYSPQASQKKNVLNQSEEI